MRPWKLMAIRGVLAMGSLSSLGCDAVREGVTGGISAGLSATFESLIFTPAEQAIVDAFPEEAAE